MFCVSYPNLYRMGCLSSLKQASSLTFLATPQPPPTPIHTHLLKGLGYHVIQLPSHMLFDLSS